jgi:hypothetical protein
MFKFDDQEPEHQVYDSWVKNIDSNQQAQDRVLAKIMAADISTADFTKTFLQYAKHASEVQDTADVVMAENGNDVSDTLDDGSATESQSQTIKQSRTKDVEVRKGVFMRSCPRCCRRSELTLSLYL